MNIPKINDLVSKDTRVKFSHYADKQLWYKVEKFEVGMINQYIDTGFTFPVPIDDTGTATFLSVDKSILFMRWIRKHIETLKTWVEESEKEK